MFGISDDNCMDNCMVHAHHGISDDNCMVHAHHGISDDNCMVHAHHGISDDNCLPRVDPKTPTRGCATLEAVFEAYDFRLEFDGRTEDFIDRFEARFKEFTNHVLKSYREYRYYDEHYAGCLESMIGGFKLQECPYKRVVTATNPYGSLYLDGKLQCDREVNNEISCRNCRQRESGTDLLYPS